MSGLLRMIQQEVDIFASEYINRMNSELVKALNELKCNYEQQMNEMKLMEELNNLSFIYKRIKYISEYPMVHEQMIAVKKEQKMMMKENEYEIPKNVTNSFVHSSAVH
ncbi:unnamed protein product [Rotaria sordida]|uniref:Uncharacterized protein n=1 Tax=Rotaria sordida TaxID=392033 RepID=A0A815VV01_9BILA|nr:unnamed protein product [Rotaria sordida]CAF1537665.1 unnamed protein product [Rotaria sordida]CAF3863798.1 unnamed protein product [Rotaria sordida]CAF3887622.1 unnamed protein product [Rotaria sordida]